MLLQNAAPDGPVTWMLKEVAERPLRLLDDDMATLSTWSSQRAKARPRHFSASRTMCVPLVVRATVIERQLRLHACIPSHPGRPPLSFLTLDLSPC